MRLLSKLMVDLVRVRHRMVADLVRVRLANAAPDAAIHALLWGSTDCIMLFWGRSTDCIMFIMFNGLHHVQLIALCSTDCIMFIMFNGLHHVIHFASTSKHSPNDLPSCTSAAILHAALFKDHPTLNFPSNMPRRRLMTRAREILGRLQYIYIY